MNLVSDFLHWRVQWLLFFDSVEKKSSYFVSTMDNTDVASNLSLQEFVSNNGDFTIYYQLLNLTGSVYIWVGTEQGNLAGLVAALGSRVGPLAASTLLGPLGAQSHEASQLAQRLQRRCKQQILLSVNLPTDDLIPHVEKRLLEELCVA